MKFTKLTEMAMVVAIAGLIGSCTSSPSKKESANVKEIVFEEAAKDVALTSNFKSIRFLQLQLTDDCVISDVKKVIDADGTIIVRTSDDEIFCFKKEDGSFLCQIGNTGEGPEEYLKIGDIYYNEKDKSVNVIDALKSDIVSYGLDGTFVRRKKAESSLSWMECAEFSTNRYLMISNQLTDGQPPSEFAYTVINPDESTTGVDPFAPIRVKGFSTKFATRPMTKSKDGLTFFKFLSDTIFTMRNGEISPVYKLTMKKKMPQKDMVAQMGSFAQDELYKLSIKGDYSAGFDKIYETKQFIALIPLVYMTEGYFWIDKLSGKGLHVASSFELNLDVDMMIQGRSIIRIVGNTDNELISCFNPEDIEIFQKELAEKKDLKPFDDRLRPFFEKADTEGNPCLIIYEH